MASGAHRHGKEPAAEDEDKFPEGLRVLAVDDDPVCLRVLQILLKLCKYNATMVTDARTALNKLREEQFDLVITDVHMPDMDGFKLLEQIDQEMDLPVILLSVNGEKDMISKGIEHGACDYIVKPPNINQLRNIWQHVVRKNQVAVNHSSSEDSDYAHQRVVQPVIAEGEQGGAKSKKCSKKKKNDGDNSDENKESTSVQTTRKKPRVSWTGELHARFLEVVNQLGVDRAVPKTILRMMNVKNLSRGSVASHLQKFRLHLKRVADEPKKSYPLGDSSEIRHSSCYMDMNHPGQPSSAVSLCGANNPCAAPSILGHQGLSIQPRNWSMGTDHTMQDALSPSHSDPAYVSVLREMLLEASSVAPTSHPDNSFAELPNGGLSEHVNQFPLLPPELISQFSSPMYTAPSVISTRRDGQFPYIIGNSSNPWQNAGSSSFPIHLDGAPLSQSQVNISQMNQLPTFGASSGQMPMFQNEQQNQMEGILNNNNNTQVFSFSEQMMPLFDIESNTAPVEMTHYSPPMTQTMVNGGSTSSPLPNLQTGSSVAPPTHMVNSSVVPPTQMVNGEDASDIFPVQDGPADQQAPDDQQTYSNSKFLEEIFANMVSQDSNPDDAYFSREH